MQVRVPVEERIERLVHLAGVAPDRLAAFRDALRAELAGPCRGEDEGPAPTSVVAISEEDAVRFRAISELASDWVYALRLDELGDLKVEWVNGAFSKLTGYDVEELNGLGGLSAIIHPDDLARVLQEGPLGTGVPTTIRYRVVTKSGRELWLLDHGCPEHDRTQERVVRVFGAVKDDTKLHTAHHALQVRNRNLEDRAGEVEARFRAVLDQAGESIYLIDWETGGLLDVNATACRVLGYTREELLTKRASDIEAGALPWATQERQNDLRTRGFAADSLHRRKDGNVFPVEIAVSLQEYAGKDHLVVVARDITERKQMEVKLAQADRLASVGVLAAGVAHEINNPLVYILNNISYALSVLPARDMELGDALREARAGAERVRDIVKDLRTFARSDERMGPMDVRQVVESAIKVVRNEIRFRAHLVCDYDEHLPLVQANARLGQVFLNLLMNAAQAISEGDAGNNRISVGVHADEDSVTVRIEDTGVGIAKDQCHKVFDPFYTTKPIGTGTGLGLSICRNIVQSLDGTLDFHSEVGRGSVFVVRLPVARAHSGTKTRSGSLAPHSSPRTLRVLIVDDDRLVAKATRRQLSPQHEVTLAGSGAEALELTQRSSFDVVLCDVMMPGMTGMEFHDRVCELDPHLARRFVFITGGPFMPQAKERLASSDQPRIQKPFSTLELLTAIEAAIAMSGPGLAAESA